MDKQTILVCFGGPSPEHDISILTGIQVFHALDKEKYDAISLYVDQNGFFYTGELLTETKNFKNIDVLLQKCTRVYLKKNHSEVFLVSENIFDFKKQKINCALLAFHGAYGEGGAFQGLCETLNLPYTSSDILGSALCMDKIAMKKILLKDLIPVANYAVAFENDFKKLSQDCIKDIEAKVAYPLFVKPANSGSSIGVSKVNNPTELIDALEVAFAFDEKVLIEKAFVYDVEVNISCLGSWNGEVVLSVPEEVKSDSAFLDFENKYLKGSKSKKTTESQGMASANRVIPAQISPALLLTLQQSARKAFKALNCGGVVRIDFLVNKKDNTFILVEVNTLPGSLAYYLWEATGVPFVQLLDRLIVLAFEREIAKQKHTRVFASAVFKNL